MNENGSRTEIDNSYDAAAQNASADGGGGSVAPDLSRRGWSSGRRISLITDHLQ